MQRVNLHFILVLLLALFINSAAFGTCGILKWSQLPDYETGSGHKSQWGYIGWYPSTVRADDFLCTQGSPVCLIRWWGSNLVRDEFGEPVGEPIGFNIKIFENNDTGAYDRPKSEIDPVYNEFFYMDDLVVEYTGQQDMLDNKVFKYEANLLAENKLFNQEGTEANPKTYWLSIIAISEEVPPLWGWEKADPDMANENFAVVDTLVENPADDYKPKVEPLDSWTQEKNDLAFELEIVPEPGTMVMMSGGLALLYLIRFRRRK